MHKAMNLLVSLVFTSMIGIAVMQPSAVTAKSSDSNKPEKSQFDLRSLNGSFASAGRADGFYSRSVGVTRFDGRGGVTRSVRINTNNSSGGRLLIDLTSVGTYEVEPDGTCVMRLTNTFVATGMTSEVTYDMVIRKTSQGGARGTLLADEIEAVQREAGVTASLIEESLTRRAGAR